MDPQVKVAHQRLSVLQLAEALGNVSEACVNADLHLTHRRQLGIDPPRQRVSG